jgi:transposase
LFNEPESVSIPLAGDTDEEVVAPTPRRGKRKPLSAELPRIEVIHELPEHELTCACGCRKHVISEETSEQLDIVPMQIRVIKHIRKVYDCRGCEAAPVTADKPAQLIENSMASPSVLAMLLTTKYVDGLPLHRFETVLSRHGIEIPRQTLARWVIQCGEHLQPLLNLMRDRLLESPVIHCDEPAFKYSRSRIEIRPANPGCGYRPAARRIAKSCRSTTPPAVRRTYRCVCWRIIAAM